MLVSAEMRVRVLRLENKSAIVLLNRDCDGSVSRASCFDGRVPFGLSHGSDCCLSLYECSTNRLICGPVRSANVMKWGTVAAMVKE